MIDFRVLRLYSLPAWENPKILLSITLRETFTSAIMIINTLLFVKMKATFAKPSSLKMFIDPEELLSIHKKVEFTGLIGVCVQ